MASLGVTTLRSVHQRVASLSGGQRQAVAVARAVMWNSRLLILDEPTAALGVVQSAQVLALVERLAAQGLGVVIVSHNLQDVFEVADRITVLRLGRNAGVFERAETTRDEIVHAITARRPCRPGGGACPRAGAVRDDDGREPGPSTRPIRRRLEARARSPSSCGGGGRTSASGEIGAAPIVIAIALITVFFYSKNPNFVSATNFNNLIVQTAGTATIAFGVVFVLLLGEIDLSVGFVSGLAGITVAELQLPGSSHQLPGVAAILLAVLVGVAIGAFQGAFVSFLGVPSFVVTLAGSLAWEGLILRELPQGVIVIQNDTSTTSPTTSSRTRAAGSSPRS